MERVRRGTRVSSSGSLPTGTSISLQGTITVSSMLATALENRSMANTTLCCENSLDVWSKDIVFLSVEFLFIKEEKKWAKLQYKHDGNNTHHCCWLLTSLSSFISLQFKQKHLNKLRRRSCQDDRPVTERSVGNERSFSLATRERPPAITEPVQTSSKIFVLLFFF